MKLKTPYLEGTVHVRRGFSLIELLIVFSIMAILMGLGVANYRGFQERQRLIAAARHFKGDLRYAQEQALAGVKPAGCGSLDSYRVSWTTSTTYEIRAMCDGSPSGILVRNFDLASKFTGIRFNVAFNAAYFNVLGRGVRNAVTVTLIDNKVPPNTSQISVTLGGEIN